MKFVKRISLFFIYPLTMFGLGFSANMLIYEYFYPGVGQKITKQPPLEAEQPVLETAYQAKPVITADTDYVILVYDTLSGSVTEEKETAPDKYIGLGREELEAELREYEISPSLKDLEKGFTGAGLISFSPSKVVIRKSYAEKEAGYFLVNENNNIVVYDKSLTHVYMDTGIRTDTLPFMLQNEIMRMKYMKSEKELYHFLESYSS